MSFSNCVSVSFVAALVAVTLGLAGCDSLGSDEESPDYVVESYLIAGQPLQRVLLSRTTGINDVYDFGDLAIRDADVKINRLNSGGSVEESFVYTLSGLTYTAIDTDALVEPGQRYQLEVTIANGDLVTAETTVPGAFAVIETNTDSVQYQGNTQVEVNVSRSEYKNRPAIFVFSIESLAPIAENLTSFYAEFFDDDEDLDQVRRTESPPINEQNYDINPDGTLTISVPWISVAFYGPNEVIANAIDDNLYDFLRSQAVQQGGSTFSPGEIPNIINNVEGGTGVFGSLARTSVRAFFWE